VQPFATKLKMVKFTEMIYQYNTFIKLIQQQSSYFFKNLQDLQSKPAVDGTFDYGIYKKAGNCRMCSRSKHLR